MGTAVKKTRGLTFDQMGKTENYMEICMNFPNGPVQTLIPIRNQRWFSGFYL